MKLVRAAAILSAAAFCLCGCGKNTASPETASENSTNNYPRPDPPDVVSCGAGIPGGKLIISEPGEPKTFNYITQNESSSADISRCLFWGLLNYDEDTQSIVPGMADFWTNSPDGKTWTFHLRKNQRWSDGVPITADDVVFTWNDLIYNTNIPNPIRDSFIIDGKKFKVTKVDDLTVRVETPEVYAPFMGAFGASIAILPKHTLERSVQEGTFTSAYGVDSKPEDIVGSGPFRLKEYKQAQYTIVERNPYFCEVDTNGTRLPYLDDVIFTIVPSQQAIGLRFLSGESDIDDFIYPSAYDQFKTEADKGKFTLRSPGTGLEMNFFWFNENTGGDAKTGKPYVDPIKLKWFRNTKFRQAISYAIDRAAIIQSVEAGRGQPAYGIDTPADKKWYNPNTQTYPHNPAKALALLKEIGIEKRNGDDFLTDTDGNKIKFVFNTNVENDARKKTAVLIVNDLQKLGMDVVFQPIEFNSLVGKIDDTYDYDCILMGLMPATIPDPGTQMNVLKSDGFTHEWFPREKTPSTGWEARIDALMSAQMQTLDDAERKKDFDEVQAIMGEQQPMIFTVIPTYYAAVRSNLGNVRPSPMTFYRASWNLEELYNKK